MRRLFVLLWRISRADLKFLWFALRQPSRPGWLLPTAVVLALYALSPLNFTIPILGIVDDLFLVPLALHWMLKLLPEDLRYQFTSSLGLSSEPHSPYRETPQY